MVMRFAVIEGGRVVNVALAEADVAAGRGWIECPPEVGPKWVYDGSTFLPQPQEEIDAEVAAAVRARRNSILKRSVDPVASNALRWSSMTADQQQAWAAYRQALLDIPQQPGFPHEVTWPSKPE